MTFSVGILVLFGVYLSNNGILAENLYTQSKTILELITATNRLRQVCTMIEEAGLSLFFEQNHITAFIPTTDALLMFDDKKYGYDLTDRDTVRSLLLYHLVSGIHLAEDLPETKEAQSLHPSKFKVYFNEFITENGKVYTANGAVLLTTNITASNGVLHIIDRVMAPVTSPKNLHDYILYPEIPNYSFSSINNASIVDLDLKMWTKDITKKFTLFLPDDNHLVTMPAYGQNKLFADWYLIRKVYHAHTVKDTIAFIPSEGNIPKLTSMEGDITFIRENNKVYVKNNRVKAMVLQPNIPTVNGIIHVIDNLLYFIYMNIVQTIQRLPNTQTFKLYLEGHASDIKSYLESTNVNKTIFVPTDTAFAKLPSSKQQQFNGDTDLLSEVLRNHIIATEVNEMSLVDGKTLTTLSNKTLTVIRRNDKIYLEYEDMQITVEETDIGCTNGVIHLISNVIFRKDYTVWEAISGNDQLLKMKNIMQDNSDLYTLLNNPAIHLTVFLPFDYVMDDIPGATQSSFHAQPDLLYNAVSGHIILGHALTTYNMSRDETFNTYGGHKLRAQMSGQDIMVTGSYIAAGVIVSDIICSNGVLHVIDNLMHVPTRNVLDEIKRHKEISVFSSFVGLHTMQALQNLLRDANEDITVFVPANGAFNDIPRSRADRILLNGLLLERILQAHIVTSGRHLIEQLYAEQNLLSVQDIIYIRKINNTVGLISNNVHSKITTSNIMATNGVIHIVDRLLYYPYFTTAETMSKDDRLLPFFDVMFSDPEFQELTEAEDTDMTVFVPSPAALENLPSNPSILTKLYLGHVLPGIKLDQKYFHSHNAASIMEQNDNVTFTLNNHTIDYSIDVGYSNLRYYFNVITDGIASSNGIIYMIGGFLNYNTRSLLEEIRNDSNFLHAFNYILRFWPANSEDRLRLPSENITLFLPASTVVDSLSQRSLDFLDNITSNEKEQFYARHVLDNLILTTKEMINYQKLKNNVSVELVDNEMFLRWNNTHSRILQPNILTSNGIIHIVDKLFIDLPEVPTTQPPDGTTKKSSQVNTSVTVFKFTPLYLLILTFFRVLIV